MCVQRCHQCLSCPCCLYNSCIAEGRVYCWCRRWNKTQNDIYGDLYCTRQTLEDESSTIYELPQLSCAVSASEGWQESWALSVIQQTLPAATGAASPSSLAEVPSSKPQMMILLRCFLTFYSGKNRSQKAILVARREKHRKTWFAKQIVAHLDSVGLLQLFIVDTFGIYKWQSKRFIKSRKLSATNDVDMNEIEFRSHTNPFKLFLCHRKQRR